MYDNLYCKVFIDADMDYDCLFSLIMDYVDGQKKAIDYIITDWCDISVRQNKEFNPEKYSADPTDFIYWRYLLDIDPLNLDEDKYINKITELLGWLRGQCRGVVIACDFEDMVNGSGVSL